MKYNFLFSLLIVSYTLFSQKIDTTKRDHGYKITSIDKTYGIFHSLKSDSNHREFPVLVFLPKNYQHGKEEFPVVYMLHGTNQQPLTEEGIRSMNNPETKILEAADFFQVIIVCPLVGNTYFMNSPIKPEQKIASFIGKELTLFMDNNYRTIKSREGRFLAGFSMGGYGAVSLLCRYPDVFSVAISRAGVMDLDFGIQDSDWDDSSNNALGSYWDHPKEFSQNSCFTLINHVRDCKDLAIVQEVGREDFLYKCNYRFNQRLNELGFNHIYAEYPGGHQWNKYCLMSMLSHLQVFHNTVMK